jgi:hypothetical protein
MGAPLIHVTEARQAKRDYDRRRYLDLRAKRDAERPPDPITLLDIAALGYLAGLTDADGCIYVTHTNRLATYYPSVTWAMTNRPTIAWVAQQLGTSVVLHNGEGRKRKGWETTHFRDYWRTSVAGARAKLLCERMLPYLHAKAAQAELVTIFPVDERRAPGRKLSEEVRAERQRLGAAISALNR